MKKIAVLPGDGIGPEVIGSALTVLDAVTHDLEFLHGEIGLECHSRTGEYLPRETLDIIDESDAVLFGAITTPLGDPNYRSPILQLRKQLDLYANVRPLRKVHPSLGLVDLDAIIVRENTEGMYTQIERQDPEGVTLERRVSIRGSRRIVRFARELAEKNCRKRITCVHKANALRRSDGLFREIFFEEMMGSNLEVKELLVDAAAAAMIDRYKEIDVIVTLNLYGDILSDEGSALTGGLGLSPSANMNAEFGLFEPVHGSAPDIAGRGVANPTAAILSAAMMLDFLEMSTEAETIRLAVHDAIDKGARTRDMKGDHSTQQFTDVVASLCHPV